MNNSFEDNIRQLTQPINNQYPRPWMTDLKNPKQAKVFIVGKNQAKTFHVDQVGSHQKYLDYLFNRNGLSCRGLYNQVVSKASPTRKNIDRLSASLNAKAIDDIIETNVICYSTPMSKDLKFPEHMGGKHRGKEIFHFLLTMIKPKVLIVHGAGTRKELGRLLGTKFEAEPKHPSDVVVKQVLYLETPLTVFIIPSLALPAYNKWHRWASEHFYYLSEAVADTLK